MDLLSVFETCLMAEMKTVSAPQIKHSATLLIKLDPWLLHNISYEPECYTTFSHELRENTHRKDYLDSDYQVIVESP